MTPEQIFFGLLVAGTAGLTLALIGALAFVGYLAPAWVAFLWRRVRLR